MKLRIKSNTLRLRLSQDEVRQLCQNGSVFSVCHIGQQHLSYGIRGSNGEDITVSFNGTRVIVEIPTTTLNGWETDDRVGFEHTDEEGLLILVEKDFQCLKPRVGEDESNLYPNPQA